jgi:hypothetical protein
MHDYIWYSIILAVLATGFFALKSIFECDLSQSPSEHPDRNPQISDLPYALFFFGLISGSRLFLVNGPLKSICGWLLQAERKKKAWAEQVFKDKLAKASTCSFKLIYMSITSAAGYYLLKDQPWANTEIGGTMPYTHEGVGQAWGALHLNGELTPGMRIYYLNALGFAIHNFYFHVAVVKHRNDFWEMVVHHIVTLLLISVSYFSGQFRVGVPVLFIHDLPDIAVYAAKASVDMGNAVVTGSSYLSMVAMWGYLRLYVFPTKVINGVINAMCSEDNAGCMRPSCLWLGSCLCVLQFLHAFWFMLFIKMGYRVATGNGFVDTQEKTLENTTADATQKED